MTHDEDPGTAEPAGPRRRLPARWLLPLAVAVVVVATFAVLATVSRGNPRQSEAASHTPDGAAAILRLWDGFPVTASPRPLVLTGPDVVDPASGFASGNDKEAYVDGRFALRTRLPTGPGTVDGQRVLSAAEALAELRNPAGAENSGGKDSSSKAMPLAITAIRFGSASFSADRGDRTLPAWTFQFAGVADPAYLLAIPPDDRWPRADMKIPDVGAPMGATISSDGHTITVSFIGAPPGTGLCQAEYIADVAQSDTAVLVSPRQLGNPSPAQVEPGTVCATGGYTRTLTVSLHSPLGNRVLIGARGAPMSTR